VNSARLPVQRLTPHFEVLNGRTAAQFLRSVVDYLQWRSGAAWRPLSQRFHPDRFDYLRAIYFVNAAQLATGACSCPYCHGAPFVGERRPMSTASAALAVYADRGTA
jgi:hypothetical protein